MILIKMPLEKEGKETEYVKLSGDYIDGSYDSNHVSNVDETKLQTAVGFKYRNDSDRKDRWNDWTLKPLIFAELPALCC